MKQFLFTFLFSLFIINSFSFAAIDPTSFVGQYRLGDCTQSGFTSVVVAPSALTNAKGLTINFYNYSGLAKSSFVALQANNTINPIKLGRSASGGRARLVETNPLGVKTFECVFYK